MVRCALSSCLVVALAACGGGGKLSVGHPTPTACSTTIPEATPWDGQPPAPGSVVIIQPTTETSSPTHVAGGMVAYEIDVKRRVVRRQIVDDADAIWKMVTASISDPMDNAGTLHILRPPPPPPDPIRDLFGLAMGASRLPVITPCEQMPQEPIGKY